MTAVVGGLRNRLIRMSIYNTVNDALDALGWFDTGRFHRPISFIDGPVGNDSAVGASPIPLNTLSLTYDTIDGQDLEIGSNLSEETWTGFLDFYAENDALGMHVASDLRDILRGKMPSIGRGFPNVTVYDYRQATPPELFVCEFTGVVLDTAHNTIHPWQKHWYSVRFDVVDAYGDEEDA